MYKGYKCEGCSYQGRCGSEHFEPHYMCMGCNDGDNFTTGEGEEVGVGCVVLFVVAMSLLYRAMC